MAVRLAFAAFAAAMTSTATAAAIAGCGQPHASVERKVPLASMRSKTPLYVMEYVGRLVKMDLRSGVGATMADHGFEMPPGLSPSADGRWLSYTGVLKGTTKMQYWLYDRHKDTEQLIYETPPWWGGSPEFSPDSRYLVINAGYGSRWGNDSRAGIHLLDTATMRMRPVPLPALRADRTDLLRATWSQDGKELLILVQDNSAKAQFSYFSYGLATGRIEAIAGRYNNQVYRHEFRRGAQDIAAFEPPRPRSGLAERSASSPGGHWRAYLDGNDDSQTYHLLVANKKGLAKPVATGGYEHCMGRTLHIIGWLDDRHLVYRNAMDYFVVDAQAGTTADLFNLKNMPDAFTW